MTTRPSLSSDGDADSAFADTYDAANRLTQVDNNGTPSVLRVILTVGYDNLDRRTRLSATVAGTADFLNGYSYAALGRMTQVTQQGQSGGNTVTAKRVDQLRSYSETLSILTAAFISMKSAAGPVNCPETGMTPRG